MRARGGRRGASAAGLMLLLASGCGESGTSPAGSAVVDILAGGVVRIANSVEGPAARDADLRLVPELVLGALDADGPTAFGAIGGLEVGADGRVYVLDRQANELRIFAPDGRHLRTVGRTGEGPGEYVQANGLLLVAPDTLLVVDHQGRRYSLLTADGDYVRSVRRPHNWFGFAFSGGHHDGRVLEQHTLLAPGASVEEARPVFLAVSLRESDPPGVDTIPLPMPSGPVTQGFPTPPGWWITIPFAPVPVYRVDPEGRLWRGHGEAFRILQGEMDGTVAREILLDVDPEPVTDDELREWRESEIVDRYRSMLGEELDVSLIPDMKPYFDDFHVASDGSLWASVPAAPMHVAWRVFDPDGIHLGRIGIAGVDRAPGVPPVIHDDRMYLAVEDELGVPRVRGFRLER